MTTTSRTREFFSRSTAGPDSSPCVAAISTSLAPAVEQQIGRAHDGARGVDDVVDDHAGAAVDLTDHFGRDRDVVRALRASLVDERDLGVEPVGESPGELAAARVGRDHRDRSARERVREILHEHRHRGEVVDREVEEALDLTGVQVDGHDAVGARDGEHVGDETAR